MAEYALTKDGSTVVQTRKFKEGETLPDFKGHPTKSAWKWFAVTRLEPSTGKPEGWKINKTAKTATFQQKYNPPVPRNVGTFAEFMALFSDSVQSAIDVAAQPGSTLSLMLKRATAANEIDLTATIVADAMTLLVTAGLITSTQKTAILEYDFNATS